MNFDSTLIPILCFLKEISILKKKRFLFLNNLSIFQVLVIYVIDIHQSLWKFWLYAFFDKQSFLTVLNVCYDFPFMLVIFFSKWNRFSSTLLPSQSKYRSEKKENLFFPYWKKSNGNGTANSFRDHTAWGGTAVLIIFLFIFFIFFYRRAPFEVKTRHLPFVWIHHKSWLVSWTRTCACDAVEGFAAFHSAYLFPFVAAHFVHLRLGAVDWMKNEGFLCNFRLLSDLLSLPVAYERVGVFNFRHSTFVLQS